MSNFKADILEAIGDEKILLLVITENLDKIYTKQTTYTGPKFEDDPRSVSPEYLNKQLTWEQAAPLLDYEYNSGYGSMDCHNIYFWTAQSVGYIHEYDGSTSVELIPRNPSDYIPNT